MRFQAVRGMKDILPGEVERWQALERLARDFFGRFGYQELRLPIMEKTELFVRSIGESTDVVEKEMYTLIDMSGDSLSLRPEATAAVCRAFVEHKIYKRSDIWKVYLIGPMFRHERPQKGRFRQFHQINCEVLGPNTPEVDAEVVAMLAGFLREAGVRGVICQINSLGCRNCRPAYRQRLIDYFIERREELCPDCNRRLSRNPFRVLDCKQAACQSIAQGAPAAFDNLCDQCAEHFAQVLDLLAGLEVPFELEKRLVRGLDYYVGVTFEMISRQLGGQDAVAGGGRYDGLVAELGGPDLPGTGFAIGMERLLLLSDLEASHSAPDVFVAALGQKPLHFAAALTQRLRLGRGQARPLRIAMELSPRSLKAQMRQANKLGARYVFIVGESELARGRAPLKDMTTGEQIELETAEATRTAAEIFKVMKM